MAHRFRKITALATSFFFLLETVCYSAPIQFPSVAGPSEIQIPRLEVQIPEEMGSVESDFQAPNSVGWMIHIQDAHGNYQAQKNIAQIVEHLTKNYKIKLLFLEAGNEKLDPTLFHFFKDHDLNLKVADLLMQHGGFTGSEIFLLKESRPQEEAPPQVAGSKSQVEGKRSLPATWNLQPATATGTVRGYGVEETDLYRRGLELFRKLIRSHEEAEGFFDTLAGRVSIAESRILSKDLRDFLKEWRILHGRESNLARYVDVLDREARRSLFMDLRDPVHQSLYPNLIRVLKLKEIETKLEPKEIQKEKEALVDFLRRKIDRPLLADLEALEVEKGHSLVKSSQSYPRFLFEKILAQAASKGLEFRNYPHFSQYASFLIFRSEIDSRKLTEETEKLTRRLFRTLGKTRQEKRLLRLIQDIALLEKFFKLEIPREEYGEIVRRMERLEPAIIIRRMKEQMFLDPRLNIAVVGAPPRGRPESDFVKGKAGTGARLYNDTFLGSNVNTMTIRFQECLEFYRLAVQRERTFIEKAIEIMKKGNETRAILVTGGFHTQGIEERLRDLGLSYYSVAPRMADLDQGHENYLRAMLEESKLLEESQYGVVLRLLHHPESLGASRRLRQHEELEAIRRVLEREGRTTPEPRSVLGQIRSDLESGVEFPDLRDPLRTTLAGLERAEIRPPESPQRLLQKFIGTTERGDLNRVAAEIIRRFRDDETDRQGLEVLIRGILQLDPQILDQFSEHGISASRGLDGRTITRFRQLIPQLGTRDDLSYGRRRFGPMLDRLTEKPSKQAGEKEEEPPQRDEPPRAELRRESVDLEDQVPIVDRRSEVPEKGKSEQPSDWHDLGDGVTKRGYIFSRDIPDRDFSKGEPGDVNLTVRRDDGDALSLAGGVITQLHSSFPGYQRVDGPGIQNQIHSGRIFGSAQKDSGNDDTTGFFEKGDFQGWVMRTIENSRGNWRPVKVIYAPAILALRAFNFLWRPWRSLSWASTFPSSIRNAIHSFLYFLLAVSKRIVSGPSLKSVIQNLSQPFVSVNIPVPRADIRKPLPDGWQAGAKAVWRAELRAVNWKTVVWGGATVVGVAAVGFGLYKLVQRLRKPKPEAEEKPKEERSKPSKELTTVEMVGAKWRRRFLGDDLPWVLAVGPFDEVAMQTVLEKDVNLDWLHPDSELFSQTQLLELVRDERSPPYQFLFVTPSHRYDKEFLEAAHQRLEKANLLNRPRGIFSLSVGKDHLAIEEATKLGFYVTNLPGVLTQSMTEVNLSALLAGHFRLWSALSETSFSPLSEETLEALIRREGEERVSAPQPEQTAFDETVAQLLFAQLLRQVQRLDEKDAYSRSGSWRNIAIGERAPSHELLGYDEAIQAKKTLGMIGSGPVADHLERYAKALEIHQILRDRPSDELLRESDVLIRIPGAPELTEQALNDKKPTAIVVDPDRLQVKESFQRTLLQSSLRGKVFGIIGLGNIGYRSAQVAAALGTKILAYDPKLPGEVAEQRQKTINAIFPDALSFANSLEDLFKEAYAVALLPAVSRDEGLHMVKEAHLNANASPHLRVFINAGRGFLVNEEHLVTALGKRPNLVAVLDVLEGEANLPDLPIEDSPIFKVSREQVLILGHTGSKETHTRRKMTQLMIENFLAALEGKKPQHALNAPMRAELRQIVETPGEFRKAVRRVQKRVEGIDEVELPDGRVLKPWQLKTQSFAPQLADQLWKTLEERPDFKLPVELELVHRTEILGAKKVGGRLVVGKETHYQHINRIRIHAVEIHKATLDDWKDREGFKTIVGEWIERFKVLHRIQLFGGPWVDSTELRDSLGPHYGKLHSYLGNYVRSVVRNKFNILEGKPLYLTLVRKAVRKGKRNLYSNGLIVHLLEFSRAELRAGATSSRVASDKLQVAGERDLQPARLHPATSSRLGRRAELRREVYSENKTARPSKPGGLKTYSSVTRLQQLKHTTNHLKESTLAVSGPRRPVETPLPRFELGSTPLQAGALSNLSYRGAPTQAIIDKTIRQENINQYSIKFRPLPEIGEADSRRLVQSYLEESNRPDLPYVIQVAVTLAESLHFLPGLRKHLVRYVEQELGLDGEAFLREVRFSPQAIQAVQAQMKEPKALEAFLKDLLTENLERAINYHHVLARTSEGKILAAQDVIDILETTLPVLQSQKEKVLVLLYEGKMTVELARWIKAYNAAHRKAAVFVFEEVAPSAYEGFVDQLLRREVPSPWEATKWNRNLTKIFYKRLQRLYSSHAVSQNEILAATQIFMKPELPSSVRLVPDVGKHFLLERDIPELANLTEKELIIANILFGLPYSGSPNAQLLDKQLEINYLVVNGTNLSLSLSYNRSQLSAVASVAQALIALQKIRTKA